MAKNDWFSNLWRRTAYALTGNIGKTTIEIKPVNKDEIKKILIVRPNHRLGNMLLITPLVQEVMSVFPNARIELFVKGGAANLIFSNYPEIKIWGLPRKAVRHIFKYFAGWVKLKSARYDLVVNAIPFSSSGRLATKAARGTYKFFGDAEELKGKHVATAPVLSFSEFLHESGVDTDLKAPVPLMDLRLTPDEKTSGEKILEGLVENTEKVICLFTYATGDKCFSKEWWKAFYEALKAKFPDYHFFEILPVENISQLDFCIPSFYSKNVREMAGVMKASRLFIGADSGIMHLASSSLVPTIGLFSVTNGEVYGPYGNGSRAIKIDGKNFDECLQAIEDILKLR